VEVEAVVAVVVDPVVGAQLAVVLAVALTAIILTLIVVLLHHLLRTVTHPLHLILGVIQLQPPLAPIPTQAGLAPQTPRLERGVATLNLPGVQPQPLMARRPPLLPSSHSQFLLLDPPSKLPPLLSFHGRKSPGVYSWFLRPILIS
jgi:hypothetical protein